MGKEYSSISVLCLVCLGLVVAFGLWIGGLTVAFGLWIGGLTVAFGLWIGGLTVAFGLWIGGLWLTDLSVVMPDRKFGIGV
jgi:hypothetical protein